MIEIFMYIAIQVLPELAKLKNILILRKNSERSLTAINCQGQIAKHPFRELTKTLKFLDAMSRANKYATLPSPLLRRHSLPGYSN